MDADSGKYYDSFEHRLDTTITMTKNDIAVWQAIKRARADYEKNECHGYYEPTAEKFAVWLNEHWGIEIKVADAGHYSIHYKIVSDDKYTMFMLKYQ